MMLICDLLVEVGSLTSKTKTVTSVFFNHVLATGKKKTLQEKSFLLNSLERTIVKRGRGVGSQSDAGFSDIISLKNIKTTVGILRDEKKQSG